jgi:ribosomal protein S18 acetylase RimI-like enzyme
MVMMPNSLITLAQMSPEEFKAYAQFSYDNYLSETARSSGKSVSELKEKSGGPPASIRPNDLWLIIKNADQNIGFLWVEIRANGEAFGWDIFINETHRSQGIGRQVMLEVGKTLSGYNIERVQICLVESNTMARKLYASLGFKEVSFNEAHKRFTLEAKITL